MVECEQTVVRTRSPLQQLTPMMITYSWSSWIGVWHHRITFPAVFSPTRVSPDRLLDLG